VAQTVSTTDWRHRSNDDALRNDALRNIALRHQPQPRVATPKIVTPAVVLSSVALPDALPSDALPIVELPDVALPNVGWRDEALRDEALRNDALLAIPGRMVVDVETREVSVELPWLDFRRRSTSAIGIDIELNAIVDRRIGLGVAGGARAKRAFDIVVTCLTAPVWLPLLVVLALLVKCTSRGKAFYAQDRVGRDGHLFRCVKLRTMASDAEHRLHVLLSSDPRLRSEYEENFKLRLDPRITRVGRMLRRSGLDELPQLLAVLRGHMSLVGPRPIVSAETEYYGPYLKLVQTVRPGLTGLWQVSGRNDLAYPLRVAFDVEYVLTRTVSSDARMILRTVSLVFRPKRRGAY
jgi:lipopolysaccharide/colanic/teichoic acid biosynthesis glycosyltransferase